ncbi:MAG: hypothetical protein MUF38_07525 [Anaerolineae bacterium]|jgi:hypothetical protein|nr:hypothetical protein [Anaerolineae bacterium]
MFKHWLLFVLLIAGVARASTQDVTPTFTAVDYEIEMADGWTAKAQLTLPPVVESPAPLVILVHGSGPYDMDATYFTAPGEEPLSANFRLIAESLPLEGVAVLRYHKRGVVGLNEYDFAQVQRSYNLDVLVDDARAVLDFALTLDDIDPEQVYLYGWSEGAWVIANLAAADETDSIAGLVMMGAPDGDLSGVLEVQWLENGLPYLRETIDADADGLLTVEELSAVPAGPVGYLAGSFLLTASGDGGAVVNNMVDSDRDGVLHIDDEIAPLLETYVANYSAYLPRLDSSYQTAELVSDLDLPLLVQHGELDGWVPLSMGTAISEAGCCATLLTYEGLGHALSPSESFNTDGFGVMEAEPIADLAAWLNGAE